MTPRLTVVVPVYNVEHYLEECLDSVAGQTLPDLDVVMVDDGSTDSGPAIAQMFADRDPRFRLVRQPNGGLGHARNTGARHADPRTRYLAFLDSDDVLPPYAYEKLTALLDESGSDFATGNVYRLTTEGRSQAWQHQHMRRTVRGTHITRDLTLLADRVAWNKVFRRSFWDRHRLAFPEGVLYEDTPLTIPAHFLADAVDVTHEHVYYWRIREGSITRRRTDVKGVRDRIAAVDSVSRFLADPARTQWTAHKRDYDRSVLTDDLLYFIGALPMAGTEYREVFMDRCRDFLTRVDPGLYPELPVDLRVKWHLIVKNRLDDLLTVLRHEERNNSGFSVTGPPLRKRAVLPRPDGTAIPLPAAATRLTRQDFPVRARVREAVWRDGKLVLSGYAYIRNLDVDHKGASRRTALLVSGHRRAMLLPVTTVRAPDATLNSRQEQHCYDWSGFEIAINPRLLRPGRWRLGILLATSGVVRKAALRPADSGSGASPAAYDLGNGMRAVPWFKSDRLHLSVEPVPRRLAGHRAGPEEGMVELTLAPRDGGPTDEQAPVALRVTHHPTGTVLDHPLEDGRTARLRLADLAAARPALGAGPKEIPAEDTETWETSLVLPDGTTARIALDASLSPGRYPLGTDPRLGGVRRELLVVTSPSGNLVLRDRTPQPVAGTVALEADGTLLVAGELPAEGGTLLVLRHSTHRAEAAFPVSREGDRFTARLRPGALESLAGTVPLREGRWYLHLRAEGSPETPDAPMRIAPGAFPALPLTATAGGKTFTLDRRFHDRLFLEAAPTLPEADRGPYNQRLLREAHYPGHRERPLRDTVLYSAFDGRQYGDSPRAVHEELVRRVAPLEHLWVVRDGQAETPPTARPVILHSAQWYEALARSRHIVTNTHLPEWFVRRHGQTVVQTWHGTPLKRTGHDLAGTLCADLTHIARPPRDPGRQWSVLLSPNARSTPLLRQALGYDGPVAETGLPRTDLLHAPGLDREKRAAALRDRLAIPPARKVVLYAPTIRDDQAYDAEHYRLPVPLPLDLAEAEQALAADHVLLVRAHPLVADQVPTGTGSHFVRDVSAHPDTAELLLIADVLVTDYSSLAADFAGTGRPMLFLAPDLEHFRDTLRGFCLDFEAQAPGPLLHATAELIGALRDLETVARHSADAYADFRTAFCHLDDGSAAARAADHILP
ncbi:CDP-glycerol glycerophosphotransferase family protein [Actinacidiphila oryziradicis]|uniref:bifunctional glycosyltransferase/CDP-glycerol:glycerophosphate glycerophosphotransferase n=1 Tax=Actinacidiphila oryziradicis TaxID=2571141 RepID=UPI0023F2AFFA|nr:CDP-glycerol glycerophosphotransferase family protein [Actinacidiphila oryziradicis]MCW2872280.1 hypothetical protein [Actinacidiphila oryziradicis]